MNDTSACSTEAEAARQCNGNKILERQCNGNVFYDAEDGSINVPDILSTTSDTFRNDEKTSSDDVNENNNLPKTDYSLHVKHANVKGDILSAAMESEISEALPGPSTCTQQKDESMECKNSESNANSGAFEHSCTISSESSNDVPSSVISDKSAMSAEVDNVKSSGILKEENVEEGEMSNINKDENNIADDGENQLVPDVVLKTERNNNDKEDDTTFGDQVVDENNNEPTKACEEDEDKMLLVKQISDGVLTESMLDQENKLHQEHLEEEKEIVNKVNVI